MTQPVDDNFDTATIAQFETDTPDKRPGYVLEPEAIDPDVGDVPAGDDASEPFDPEEEA